MPQISVIVPVYKVEPYIHSCVDSILEQTYTDFELILVDDGSPDNCGAICDEYAKKDNRIKVIHQENGGLSAARNAGIDIAEGEYITFVDSDDLIAKKYLKTLYNAIISTGADIAICDKVCFKDGERYQLDDEDCMNEIKNMSGREACLSIYRMDGKIPITAWGKLYKAGLFDDIRYPVGKIHEDDATTPKLLYKSKNVVQIKQKLYLYRIMREGSIMNQPFSVKRFDSMDAVDSCIRFFEQKSDYDLVKISKQAKRVMQSKMIIQANKNNAKNEIPREYRMKKLRALINLHRYVSQSLFEWYLSLAYPGLVKPYSYAEKIVSTLRKGKKT